MAWLLEVTGLPRSAAFSPVLVTRRLVQAGAGDEHRVRARVAAELQRRVAKRGRIDAGGAVVVLLVERAEHGDLVAARLDAAADGNMVCLGIGGACGRRVVAPWCAGYGQEVT
jgi:hypothetical protein